MNPKRGSGPELIVVNGSLREFCPDDEKRCSLLYTISHRFLPQYLFKNPRAFFTWDEALKSIGGPPVSPTLFIQSRISSYLLDSDEDRIRMAKDGAVISRRIADLHAEWLEGMGKKAMLIRLPVPERSPHAFFVLAASLVVPDNLPQAPPINGQVRFFTLELGVDKKKDRGIDEPAVLCEWTEKMHCLIKFGVAPVAEQFMAEVQSILDKSAGAIAG